MFELGLQADHPDAEAIVLSCTDMRSVEVIERLEAAVGKPVVSSNQAMLFAVLQALEVDPGNARCGALFKRATSVGGRSHAIGA